MKFTNFEINTTWGGFSYLREVQPSRFIPEISKELKRLSKDVIQIREKIAYVKHSVSKQEN